MTRHDLRTLLEGTHPRHGRRVAMGLNAVILISALSIALETISGLPPLVVRVLTWLEWAILTIFALEYLARLISAPVPWRYALSFWGIVDLLACLPLIGAFNSQWAGLRVLRALRLLRLLKLTRAEAALDRLVFALRSVQGDLVVFSLLAVLVLYFAALGIYVFEHEVQPDTFGSIPESFWWAIVSFTTVGYGDAYPVTVAGRIFTSAILFIGLGVIAVPAAVITSALIDHSRQDRERKDQHDASQLAQRHPHHRPRHGRGQPGSGR